MIAREVDTRRSGLRAHDEVRCDLSHRNLIHSFSDSAGFCLIGIPSGAVSIRCNNVAAAAKIEAMGMEAAGEAAGIGQGAGMGEGAAGMGEGAVFPRPAES